ncbi:hypothetical protein E3P94_02927 [Wallemia ichthyophaga]|nr:hypothetical protein E3P95_02926 [Wallemia ichthyophaga]TIA98458.1 hypothetical protein E3P94_02927 [Wallemia ichthyophaga]
MPKKWGNKKQPIKNTRQPTEQKGLTNQNPLFDKYYKSQNLLDDGEWNSFIHTAKQLLPTSFRITGNKSTANDLNQHIKKTYIPFLSQAKLDGVQLPPPKQLDWYPDGLAWQLNLTKQQIRKSPEFKKFQNFLVYENEAGNISRQEAVSMIPPLLLKMDPHHSAIDMCAAPGSKTAQLLEALHSDPHTDPTGLVVANDSDNKRAYLLVHQTSRLPSPNIMVTNHDATSFPNIYTTNPTTQARSKFLFDRVLCDVPCTGDGTVRKNLEIWSHWTPNNGNGLHTLQLRILNRGIQLLKPGGRLVYSTCSINPVENEAVIAAALRDNPQMSLVDAAEERPQLKRKEGLKHWHVNTARDGIDFGDRDLLIENARDERERDRLNDKLPRTMWPPSQQDADNMLLERCLRVYSHQQDTGSFFIAVLEKKEEKTQDKTDEKKEEKSLEKTDETPQQPPADSTKRPLSPQSLTTNNQRPQKKSKKDEPSAEKGKVQPDTTFKEDPFSYLDEHDEDVKSFTAYYKFDDTFPRRNLLVRNPNREAGRTIYLTSDLVRNILHSNDYTRLRLISSGVKLFVKQDNQRAFSDEEKDIVNRCKWRVTNESVSFVKKYLPPQAIFRGTPDDLKSFVEHYHPVISSIGGANGELRDVLQNTHSGSHIVEFSLDNGENGLSQPVYVPLWKSKTSVSMMVDKKERSALSLRLFGEDLSEAGRKQAEVQKQREERMKSAAENALEKEGENEEKKEQDNAETIESKSQPTDLSDQPLETPAPLPATE